MNDILKYTEDKRFIRWVHNPNKELDSYWDTYKKNNPDQLEEIEKARNIVLHLKSKKEDFSEDEANNLFSEIMAGVEKEKQSNVQTRTLAMSILRYAAVFVFILLAIGGYYFINRNGDLEVTAESLMLNSTDISGNSELLLADGQTVSLLEKNSSIECLTDNQVVINGTDTVKINIDNQQNVNQLKLYRGKNSTIKLVDGTTVHLNAGSHLIFSTEFSAKQRNVFLVGEGFFDVAHNPKSPFIVNAENVVVEVLGTKFNLSAYASDDVVETYLQEGKVKISSTGNEGASNQEEILEPQQNAVYNKNNEEVIVSNITDEDYISWYKGYINLSTDNITSVVKKLERYFDVNIDLSNHNLEANSISGKLKYQGEEIETVLEVLANAATLKVQKNSDTSFSLK